MGFFNPALLWFALGCAIPIIIHLLHRQKFKRVRWAAMEFLLAALKKTRRRMQIENLLLLLLRILIMVLLALAIARPFFREAPVEALGDSDCHHFFVIDQSYSMAYKRAQHTSLDVAKRAALKVLQDIHASEQDRFTILPLSAYPEPILVNSNRKERIQTAINELKPSDFGTSVHATMQSLSALLESSEIKNRDRRVYLFTDMQRNGWLLRDEAEAKKFTDLLKGFAKKQNTKFFLYDAGTPDAFNHAIVDLRANDRVITTKRTTRFTASIHNYSSIPRPAVNVGFFVNDNLVKTEPTVLPPGATTPVTFEYDFAEAAPHIVKVAIDPDYLDVDDSRYLAVDVKSALRALVIDGEPKDNPREGETWAFVLALDPGRQGLFFSVDLKTVELFNAEGLDGYDFLVLANVQSLTSDRVEKIENFVQRGGGLFLTLGNRVDKVSFNEFFWKKGAGLSPAQLEEIAGEAPGSGIERGIERRISKFNLNHPMFRTFQKRTMAALYDLVFYKYYKIKDHDPEKVLASLDDNFASPLFLEKALGDGKVVLLTSTIDYEWNAGIQGKPPYLPLMWDLCRYLSSRPSSRRNVFVGELIHIDLPVEAYQPPFILDTSTDGSVTLPASTPERDQKSFRLSYPSRAKSDDPKVFKNEGVRSAGKYKLLKSAAKEEEKLVTYFAVNVGPREPTPEEIQAAEGNLERISKEDIQKMYPDFKIEFRGEKKEGANEIDLSPPPASGLWKYLMYFLVGFLLLESGLACVFGRGKQ
jgi:uncharacterized membrane protein